MLNCFRREPDYTTQLVMRLHLPHGILVKLHAHQVDVVIFQPQTAFFNQLVGLFIVEKAMDVDRSGSQWAHNKADVNYLVIKKVVRSLWYAESGLNQLSWYQ